MATPHRSWQLPSRVALGSLSGVVPDIAACNRCRGVEAPQVAVSGPPADIAETVNHVRAMHLGLSLLDELPLSGRPIRRVHEEPMKGVRGQERNPGEFRTTQNWTGPACACRKLRRGWSGGISVLVDESATAGRSQDLEVSIWLVWWVGGDGW